MEKRKIKHTDIEVAPINFGGNVFGWTLDEKQSFEILDKFVDGGFNFIDTADTYAWWVNGTGGQSETIIGNWLKARNNRGKVVIATKVGSQTKEHGYDISRAHILQSVDQSLKRLQTDYIDLYYTHFDDEKTPVEETMEAYNELVKAGKVRHIAVSNVSPTRIDDSFAVAEQKGYAKYVALQPHYNLLERIKFETEYAPLVEKYDLSVFAYWSLAAGFLTGKYRTEADFAKTARGQGIKKYFNDHGLGILNALDNVATKHESLPATIALAWLLANPLITAPIVSATSDRQLQTIFDAPNILLDKDDLDLLNGASA
ncbi:MAG: aldo/keto reductase [Chitinophagaceae bacterium]